MIESRALRKYEILVPVLLVLALTLPFIGQAVHMDARLLIDWARQALEHPLWNHIPDYDYFGAHYDEFHDTHPRLLSLYASLFLNLNGGDVSVPLLHLAFIPFPVIAAVSMYLLARRFRVNALLAALLLVVSPAFLVNSHLIMTDIPGLSLWLAGITLFIYGVDRDRLALMLAAGVVFTLCIFTYYQGLSVLPLALLYAFSYRRIDARTMSALAIPLALFLVYLSVYMWRYGEFINLAYPFGLPLGVQDILGRLRGVVVLLGGALIFPVAALVVFANDRKAAWIAAAGGLLALAWAALAYLDGDIGIDTFVLLPLLLAAGAAVLWEFALRFGRSLRDGLRAEGRQEDLFLSTWFLGTCFYSTVLLPYAAPRFLLPLAAPLVIVATMLISRAWGDERRRLLTAAILILASTLALALAVAVAEHRRAGINPEIGDWARERFEGHEGTVWFSSGLGFQYYTEGQGYRMLIKDDDAPAPGDLIFESVGSNRWRLPGHISGRIELVEEVEFPRSWPLVSEYAVFRTSWTGQVGTYMPYGFTGDYADKVFVYAVVAESTEGP